MTKDFRRFEHASDYQFGCPEGTWRARLDQKGWGKSNNLILYFSDTKTARKYSFSVFCNNEYKPRDNSLSFKSDAEPGDIFELTTTKNKKGNPELSTARKVITDETVALDSIPHQTDNLFVMDEGGNVYPLTPELVGDTRENFRRKLADLDISQLPTIEETRAIQGAERDSSGSKQQP